MVYVTISPAPSTPSLSVMTCVFATATSGFDPMVIRVGSFSMLPSKSSPSSETSEISTPCAYPIAVTVFETNPVSYTIADTV